MGEGNNQKTILQTYREQHGHTCLYYQKLHCELSHIERVWWQSNRFTQKHAIRSIVWLHQIAHKGLGIPHDQLQIIQGPHKSNEI